LNACFGLIIPNADSFVIATGDQVGFVAAVVVIDAINALVVAFEGEIGDWGAEVPNFDGMIQRGGSKGVGVLWIELDLHDVVRMALEHHGAIPIFIPVPGLDEHVIGTTDDDGESRMYADATDVIDVGLEYFDALHRVVIVAANIHIVRADDNPLLPGDESTASHGLICDFKSLDDVAFLVIVDEDAPIVE